MTVTTQYVPDNYIGDGSITAFTFTFGISAPDDIVVFIDDLLVDPSNYTTDDIAMTVTFNVAPLAGEIILLGRATPLTQQTDYIEGDSFPSESHEDALDKLTFIVQESGDSVDRALRYPLGDTSEPVLPIKSARLNKFLAFDNNGDATVLSGTTGDPNSVQKPLGAVVAGNLMEFDATKDAVDSGSSLASLKAEIYNAIYPVGSLKIGIDPTPVIGGTWTQLPEGTFLMNTVAGADTAGGANVTNLAIGQMPNHNHGGGDHVHSMKRDSNGFGTGGQSNPITGFGSLSADTDLSGDVINSEGNSDDIENRPVYKGVAIWERTA